MLNYQKQLAALLALTIDRKLGMVGRGQKCGAICNINGTSEQAKKEPRSVDAQGSGRIEQQGEFLFQETNPQGQNTATGTNSLGNLCSHPYQLSGQH